MELIEGEIIEMTPIGIRVLNERQIQPEIAEKRQQRDQRNRQGDHSEICWNKQAGKNDSAQQTDPSVADPQEHVPTRAPDHPGVH